MDGRRCQAASVGVAGVGLVPQASLGFWPCTCLASLASAWAARDITGLHMVQLKSAPGSIRRRRQQAGRIGRATTSHSGVKKSSVLMVFGIDTLFHAVETPSVF